MNRLDNTREKMVVRILFFIAKIFGNRLTKEQQDDLKSLALHVSVDYPHEELETLVRNGRS